MPVQVNLDRVILHRRFNLTELAERIDISSANLSILKAGKAKAIRYSTLAALCRERDCQPRDLLEYTDEQNCRSDKDSLIQNLD